MKQSLTATSTHTQGHALSFQRLSLQTPHQYLQDLPLFFHHAPHLLQPQLQPSSPLTAKVRSMSLADLLLLSEIGSLRHHNRRTTGLMQEEAKKKSGIQLSVSVTVGQRIRVMEWYLSGKETMRRDGCWWGMDLARQWPKWDAQWASEDLRGKCWC